MAVFRILCSRATSSMRVGASLTVFTAAIAVLQLLVLSQLSAEPRQAPNSHVVLDLGDAFKPSDRFSGFMDEATGVSFVIVEMPASAYDELKVMPDQSEALAQRGLTDAKAVKLPGRGGDYVYFTAKQTVQQPTGSVEVAKFVLIFRDGGLTVMISSNVPQTVIDAGTYSKDQIEKIIASASLNDSAAKTAGLFRLSYLGPFKEAFGLMGTTKGYNVSGTQPAQGQNLLVKEPTLLVAPSLDRRTVSSVKATALARFRSLAGLRDHKVESDKLVTIGGMKGHQVIGETVDETGGAKIAINLVLLTPEEGGYYVLIGTTPLDDKEKFMPEIEKVIASFEVVR